jgi:hypothetical protein
VALESAQSAAPRRGRKEIWSAAGQHPRYWELPDSVDPGDHYVLLRPLVQRFAYASNGLGSKDEWVLTRSILFASTASLDEHGEREVVATGGALRA